MENPCICDKRIERNWLSYRPFFFLHHIQFFSVLERIASFRFEFSKNILLFLWSIYFFAWFELQCNSTHLFWLSCYLHIPMGYNWIFPHSYEFKSIRLQFATLEFIIYAFQNKLPVYFFICSSAIRNKIPKICYYCSYCAHSLSYSEENLSCEATKIDRIEFVSKAFANNEICNSIENWKIPLFLFSVT